MTARGPRTPLHEFLAGAAPYEVDACFLDEKGRPLIRVAGGHENMIPECAHFDGEPAADTDPRDMEVAVAAMKAIGSLRVANPFRPEQTALTSGLGFIGFGEPRGLRSPPSGATEQGAVVFEYPGTPSGAGRAISPD